MPISWHLLHLLLHLLSAQLGCLLGLRICLARNRTTEKAQAKRPMHRCHHDPWTIPLNVNLTRSESRFNKSVHDGQQAPIQTGVPCFSALGLVLGVCGGVFQFTTSNLRYAYRHTHRNARDHLHRQHRNPPHHLPSALPLALLTTSPGTTLPCQLGPAPPPPAQARIGSLSTSPLNQLHLKETQAGVTQSWPPPTECCPASLLFFGLAFLWAFLP